MKIKRLLNDFFYYFFKTILSIIFFILYHPKIVGKEKIPKKGACVIAGNHRHIYDPCCVCVSTHRQVHYLATHLLFEPFYGFFFRLIGCIKVKEKGNENALEEAEEVLNNGGLIGIYPEGKRNFTDETLLPFKTGAVRMAKATNTPILPFCIVGEYKRFFNNLKVVYGEPFYVGDMDVHEATELLQNKVLKLIEENK